MTSGRQISILLVGLLSTSSALSCSSSTSPTQSTGTGNTNTGLTNHGSMSADIDGVHWTAVVIVVNNLNGVLHVGGQDSMTTPFVALGFAVPSPTAVGSYTVNTATGPTVAGSLDQQGTGVAVLQWNANGGAGSGTINVTSSTSTGLTGTFSFTLVHIATQSTGSKTITNGVFNITY